MINIEMTEAGPKVRVDQKEPLSWKEQRDVALRELVCAQLDAKALRFSNAVYRRDSEQHEARIEKLRHQRNGGFLAAVVVIFVHLSLRYLGI